MRVRRGEVGVKGRGRYTCMVISVKYICGGSTLTRTITLAMESLKDFK